MITPHWIKTSTGYALGTNRLVRSGRRWRLITEAGFEHDLGPRASFDHADAIVEKELAS